MRINEICIGNFLILKSVQLDEYNFVSDKVIKVDDVYKDVLSTDKYLINGYPVNFYSPIIINEHWISKLGFHYFQKYDEWFQNADSSGIKIERDYESGYFIVDSIKCKYVHQLQNIISIIEAGHS